MGRYVEAAAYLEVIEGMQDIALVVNRNIWKEDIRRIQHVLILNDGWPDSSKGGWEHIVCTSSLTCLRNFTWQLLLFNSSKQVFLTACIAVVSYFTTEQVDKPAKSQQSEDFKNITTGTSAPEDEDNNENSNVNITNSEDGLSDSAGAEDVPNDILQLCAIPDCEAKDSQQSQEM